jgi:hypothetical protein
MGNPTLGIRFMCPVTFDELMNCPVTDLPSKTLVDAQFDGTRYMHDFAQEVMMPVLKTLLSPTPQEIAVRDTYYKMHLHLKSVLALNKLEHFQALALLTRSLFELLLDICILARDTTGDAVNRYDAFPEIERYRVAELLIKFSNKNPQSLRMDITPQRAFHAEPARTHRIANAITGSSGKRKYPDHWTGKNVRERAIAVGEETMYVEVYPQMSWFVHAGPAGTAGIPKEGFENIFAVCHSLIQRIFIAATAACAKATKISSLIISIVG